MKSQLKESGRKGWIPFAVCSVQALNGLDVAFSYPRRAIYFIEAIVWNANLTWKHPHRHTRKKCFTWASCGPSGWHIKLTITTAFIGFLQLSSLGMDLGSSGVVLMNAVRENLGDRSWGFQGQGQHGWSEKQQQRSSLCSRDTQISFFSLSFCSYKNDFARMRKGCLSGTDARARAQSLTSSVQAGFQLPFSLPRGTLGMCTTCTWSWPSITSWEQAKQLGPKPSRKSLLYLPCKFSWCPATGQNFLRWPPERLWGALEIYHKIKILPEP